MKRTKNVLVRSKDLKSTSEISELLHKIADRIDKKKINFVLGEKETEIILPDRVYFKLSAHERELKKKSAMRRVNIQLKWHDGLNEKPLLDIK